MKKLIFLLSLIVTSTTVLAQKEYKKLMSDMSINFYDVCESAESYFETHEKGKGSGWKGYQRWKNTNEPKYYPTGNRSNINPYFVTNTYKAFLKNNPSSLTKSSFNNGWEELGPHKIETITGHYSAGLGRIETAFIDKSNPNRMYLGSRSGGFWKSEDAGLNWQGGLTDFLIATGVNTITASPTNSDSVLINIQNSNNYYSHGIYRSTDAGDNWSESNFNPTTLNNGGLGNDLIIYMVKYHPTVPNLIFIGTNDGIYRSADNLATWTQLYSNKDIAQIEFHPTNNNIIYFYEHSSFSNSNFVYRSVDQGISYVKSNQITDNSFNSNVRLSTSDACENCLFFASDNGVFKSTDSGENFVTLGAPNSVCRAFSVSDTDINNMIFGYVDLYASFNGGVNFNRTTRWSLGNTNGAGSGHQTSFDISTNYIHADLRYATSINGVFYVCTDGLFSKSEDNGVSWQNISQGVSIREYYKLGISQSNHYRAMYGSQDNGESIKTREGWIEFYGADGMESIIHPLNDDWIIGSVQYGSRRRTKDGGMSQGGANPSGSESGYWEAPLAYDPNNQMRIYDFRENVYMSEDFGSNYINVGNPNLAGEITNAAIAENNSNIIVVSRYQNIKKTINGGQSWTNIKIGLPNYTIEDIAFDPKNDNTIIITYAQYQNDNQKIYMTSDGGASWTNITYNLGDLPIHSAVIDHSDASNIYIGTEIGVYTKPLIGTTWTLYNPNLPNCSVEELEINYGTNTLKAATWGRGAWEYTLLDRNDFPNVLMTSITNQPTDDLPNANVDQYVTSIVKSDLIISNVYLEWSLDTADFGNQINMTNTIDSTWVSDLPLPGAIPGTKMFFKVFAVGNNNDTTETYKFMFTYQDSISYSACTPIKNNDDDVEENKATNSMSYNSSDLELCYDSNDQLIGLRFQELPIPPGVFIDTAYIQFSAKESDNSDLNINISAENVSNSQAWNDNAPYRVSDRVLLPQTIIWNHDNTTAWTANNTISKTPELKSIVQHLINDSGWELGNAMSFVLWNNENDTDKRVAYSKDGGDVPTLCVNFSNTPTLSYIINESVICENEMIHFNYSGSVMDSIIWEFTNGTETFTSTNINDSLLINASGIFNLTLTTYSNGIEYNTLAVNSFETIEAYTQYTYLTTCDPLLTDTTVQYFTAQNGCDSSFYTITLLKESYDITLNQESCNPANVGTATQNLQTIYGCDSTVTTITTLVNEFNTTLNLLTCDPNNVGSSVQNLTAIFGCDSTVTTFTTLASNEITINNFSCDLNDVGTVIETYSNGNGCDSTIITYTTFKASDDTTIYATVCDGGNGGIDVQYFTNINGCDSTITTITTQYQIFAQAIQYPTYMKAFPDNAQYQWINCETAPQAIVSETGQQYIIPNNGSYAVKVTQFGCVDTSECNVIDNLGLTDNDNDILVNMFPNPTNGNITISLNTVSQHIVVKVTNSLGQVIISKEEFNTTQFDIDLSQMSTGIYYIHINDGEKSNTQKVIKQ